MCKYSIAILISYFIYSCTSNERNFYPSGVLKEEYQIKNNKKNGVFKSYYESSNLKSIQYFKENNNIDSSMFYNDDSFRNTYLKKIHLHKDTVLIINYFDNNTIKSKGIILRRNNRKIGFWEFYYNNSILEKKVEYLNIENSEYLNRTYIYDKSGHLLNNESNYYTVEVEKDTFKINELIKIYVYLDEPFFSYDAESFVLIAKDKDNLFNDDFSNMNQINLDTIWEIKKDPYVNKKSILKDINTNRLFVFAINFREVGIKNFSGIIVETDPEKESLQRYLFFRKTFYIRK